MNDLETAQHLLVSSYRQAAARVLEAIRGGFPGIPPSPGPVSPPTSPGEVVGLCGQGGRHPYFRIPRAVLEATLDRIYRAGSSPDKSAEELASACRDLRQQTYFDTGTGCVNDQLPSMVPLLPPIEVWLDGKELPLDVWRFVCFEYDLVSSAVASRVAVDDFAFSAATQSGLAFRILIDQLGSQRTRFNVELRNLPVAWTGVSPAQRSIDVSLARIFFEAGSLLTPLAQELTRWYGAVRYAHWVDQASAELRVLDDFNRDSVDCRYRGLFAEESAIGLMAVVLSDIFGASPINNSAEVLPASARPSGQPIADFIAQCVEPGSGRKTTIVAESKGSLGRRISNTRHIRAKQQVAATRLTVAGFDRILPLAFGSRISFSSQNTQTHCLVDDPDSDFQEERIRVDPLTTWRVAYAKTLRFIGMETAAEQVRRGDGAESVRPMDFDRNMDRARGERDSRRLRRTRFARERFGVDLVLDAGSFAIGLDPRVLGILRHGLTPETEGELEEAILLRRKHPRREIGTASFTTSLGFGCIAYSDLDERGESDRE